MLILALGAGFHQDISISTCIHISENTSDISRSTCLHAASASENKVDISTSISARPSARAYVLMLISVEFSLA